MLQPQIPHKDSATYSAESLGSQLLPIIFLAKCNSSFSSQCQCCFLKTRSDALKQISSPQYMPLYSCVIFIQSTYHRLRLAMALVHQFSSVQLLSRVWLFVTSWTAARQASLSITNSRSLLKLMSIESVMPSNHLILCRPLHLLPSMFPSIRVFSNESILHITWPKYWSFTFNISPSNEYSGLISFRMDWLDLLAVQGTLKSLLQHYSSKASILWRSAFFIIQLSRPYMTLVHIRPLISF